MRLGPSQVHQPPVEWLWSANRSCLCVCAQDALLGVSTVLPTTSGVRTCAVACTRWVGALGPPCDRGHRGIWVGMGLLGCSLSTDCYCQHAEGVLSGCRPVFNSATSALHRVLLCAVLVGTFLCNSMNGLRVIATRIMVAWSLSEHHCCNPLF